MADLVRVALLFRLMPGYNEGVVRGLASYARPGKPWLFRLFNPTDAADIKAFKPHAGICSLTDEAGASAVRKLRLPLVNIGVREFVPALVQAGNDDQAIGAMAAMKPTTRPMITEPKSTRLSRVSTTTTAA